MLGSLGSIGLGAMRSVGSTGTGDLIGAKVAEWGTNGLVREGLAQLSVTDLRERVGDIPRLTG